MTRRNLPNAPWITKDGHIDMTKLPLERTYQQAVGSDRQAAQNALRTIGSASHYGRTEATVFLMGFLVNLAPDDWELREAVVEALSQTKTASCAALLFSEIRRVKCSNTTRRYVNTIINVLKLFPEELVRDQFEALAAEGTSSQRMRRKFREAAEAFAWRNDW